MHLITGPSPELRLTATSASSVPPAVVAIYPMTRAQESLWLAYSASPQHTMYNLTIKLSFDTSNPAYSLGKLLEGVNMLTTRHGILRSTFHQDRNILAQPFVAEWAAHSAQPSVQVLSKPTPTALKSGLRSPVDLSSQFAVRWIISEGESAIDLYLVAHHIAVDGISMSVLSVEFLNLLSDSGGFIISPDSFYKAHMIEVAYRASSTFKTAEDFWLSQCRSVVPVHWKELSQAPGSANYREIDNWFEFSKTELDGWSTRFKTSWFRVAVALIGLLVRLFSEPTPENHVLLVAFAGRPEGMAQTVGHFANALPIRIPLTQILRSESPTCDALVQSVSKAISTAKTHDRLSFVDLCDALRRGGLRTPQFQVAITLSPQLAGPNCALYPVEGDCDLLFCFLEEKECVSLGVIYDPSIFSAAMVAKIKNQFRELLDSALREDPLDLTSLPSLSTQIPRLLADLDLKDTTQISATRFHFMFEYQVARNPTAVALASAEEDKSLTYSELNKKSTQIARLLRKSGVQRNNIVILHLRRGFPMIEWSLGVLKSGATFAVADQSHPLERIRNVIFVAQPDLIVDDGNGHPVEDLTARLRVTLLDTRQVNLEGISADDLQDISEPTDLAFIVFTSGSSGQPKGVEIEHRNLSHLVVSAHASGYFPVSPGSRVLQFAPFSFDAAIFEWSLCLALGGTLCFSMSPHALVGNYLADVINSNRVTHMHLTPSILATLPTDRALPSLSYISIGGEMAQDAVIELWRARANVQNGYGPSECTIAVSHQSYSRGNQDQQVSAANVGKPHPNATIYVCDETSERVLPTDHVGEICIGGPQVGRGYRNQQGLTAGRFVNYPEVGQQLYRTGDRGKILPDGSIYLLGRIDREVKMRGHRINLEDLERTILDLVPEVVNVSVQMNPAGTSLCAFVVPETINSDQVKKQLSSKLPRYMVPSAIHCLACLPLNANGKTDHTLIANTLDDLVAQAQHSQPSCSPVQPSSLGSKKLPSVQSEISVLQTIWQTLLALDRLPRPESNFFELGGNSITLVSLHQRICTKWPNSSIGIVDLFQHPTIQSQTSLVLEKDHMQSLEPTIAPPKSKIAANFNSFGTTRQDVAIIGIAGRFPGALNAEELYQLLLDQTEAFSFLPSNLEMCPGSKYVPVRGVLPDVHHFNYTHRGITEDTARQNRDIDPQQRLFLAVAEEALQDANYNIGGSNNVGVYVGAANGTWHLSKLKKSHVEVDGEHQPRDQSRTPVISAQTAYHLNLQGPNITLNTACSSGLVAMSLAVDHLRSKRCDAALVGGVSITFPQTGYITTDQSLLSPSGHCRPFDHRADGTVPGDAVCALVLRRFNDALEAGDQIYSVISGITVSSDGNMGKAGPTVPSSHGQAQTIKQAWEDAGMSATTLLYAELHGSGTPIGDALELEAMNLARTELGAGEAGFIAGSNKGNIGNCEAASGLVSVIKICKSFQHGLIPPVQSFEALHPIINPRIPVQIANNAVPISDGAVVSVSSIGLGGVNAHCILQSPGSK
ncbi:non-ribosomal peptide synthetase [Mycena sanguinolenta]|nr:non-ribosomal peptide synthetase [Mycena sanguinolenta]